MIFLYVIGYLIAGVIVNILSNMEMSWKGWSLELILLWPLALVLLAIVGVFDIIDIILSHLDDRYRNM